MGKYRLSKKRAAKPGLSPGAILPNHDKSVEPTHLTVFSYNSNEFHEACYTVVDDAVANIRQGKITWINVDGVHDVKVVERFGQLLGIHSLVLEDIVTTDQRPKAEFLGDYLYIVIRMLYHDANRAVVGEQVSIILTANAVISFQEHGRKGDVFEHVRERLRTSRGRIRGMGSDYLCYGLLDSIVDYFYLILEETGERIERLEEEIINCPTTPSLQRLYAMKRELLFLRRSIWPTREMINTLLRNETPLLKKGTLVFLQDIYDHAIQVIDSIETFREMLASMIELYMSSVSNRLNNVMKFLTLIATIFMPLTFIAGIYGMNFDYMPELHSPWGYPATLAVMALVAFGMIFYFKRKGWI